MARFKCIQNPKSIVTFDQPWDVESMRLHPDYVEIDDEGNHLREIREDRAPWHFVFTPSPPSAPVAKPVASRGKRK